MSRDGLSFSFSKKDFMGLPTNTRKRRRVLSWREKKRVNLHDVYIFRRRGPSPKRPWCNWPYGWIAKRTMRLHISWSKRFRSLLEREKGEAEIVIFQNRIYTLSHTKPLSRSLKSNVFFFSYWQWHYNICWSRRGGTERVNFCRVFITYFVFARKFSKIKVLFLFFYQKQRLIQILTLLIEMERVGSHSLGKGSKCIKMLCLYMEVGRAKFLWGEGIECLRGKMNRSPHLSGEKFFFKANDFA